MIVIQHKLTGERFMYPSSNDNYETPEGFVQTQYVPKNFILSPDQTPVEIHYYNTGVKWEADSKDPVDTISSKIY